MARHRLNRFCTMSMTCVMLIFVYALFLFYIICVSNELFQILKYFHPQANIKSIIFPQLQKNLSFEENIDQNALLNKQNILSKSIENDFSIDEQEPMYLRIPIENPDYQYLIGMLRVTPLKFSLSLKNITNIIRGKEYDSKSFISVHHTCPVYYPDLNSKQKLSEIAIDGVVIITYVDMSYIPQLISFMNHSIKKFNIQNFIPIVPDSNTRNYLLKLGVDSLILNHPRYVDQFDSSFGSQSFVDKVNMKTLSILHCLFYGYTVLFTDVDIVFLKNPLQYMDNNYDINIQMESYIPRYEVNSGFIYVRPTFESFDCLFTAWDLYKLLNRRQQLVLNEAIHMHEQRNLKVRELNLQEFAPGNIFFEYQHTMFYGDQCDYCVMVHNNWITGRMGKLYRLKELGYYSTDIDSYYKDLSRKFIYIDISPTLSLGRSLLLLSIYLSKKLNRTLILPRMKCTYTMDEVQNYWLELLHQYELYNYIYYNGTKHITFPLKISIQNSNIKETSRFYSLFDDGKYYYLLYENRMKNKTLFSTILENKPLMKEWYEKRTKKRRLESTQINVERQIKRSAKRITQIIHKKYYNNKNYFCTVNNYICIKSLDNYLEMNYRESSFIDNPNIPESLRSLYYNTPFIDIQQISIENTNWIQQLSTILIENKQYSSLQFLKILSFSLSKRQSNELEDIKKIIKSSTHRQTRC